MFSVQREKNPWERQEGLNMNTLKGERTSFLLLLSIGSTGTCEIPPKMYP